MVQYVEHFPCIIIVSWRYIHIGHHIWISSLDECHVTRRGPLKGVTALVGFAVPAHVVEHWYRPCWLPHSIPKVLACQWMLGIPSGVHPKHCKPHQNYIGKMYFASPKYHYMLTNQLVCLWKIFVLEIHSQSHCIYQWSYLCLIRADLVVHKNPANWQSIGVSLSLRLIGFH